MPGSMPEYDQVFTAWLTGFKRADGAAETRYFASRTYPPRQSYTVYPGTPLNKLHRARIARPPNTSKSLGILARAVQAQPTIGSLLLLNDADLDDMLTDYVWTDAVLKMGSVEDFYEDLLPLYTGKVKETRAGLQYVEVVLSELGTTLQKRLQPNVYAGTGGDEGGPELKGRVKPRLYGECRNIEPVAVDLANLRYQIHDGAISTVTKLYVNGVEWTYNATPGASQWTFNASTGFITLGGSTPPNGIITCDAKGDASGGYVDTAGAIVARMLSSCLGFTATGTLTDWGYNVGAYFRDEILAAQAVDRICQGAACWWQIDRAGLLQIRKLGTLAASSLAIPQANLFSLSCLEAPLPVWRVQIDFDKVWRPMTDAEVAGSVTAAERARLTSPNGASRALAADSATLTRYADAAEIIMPGIFADQADAQAVADSLITYFKQPLKVWQVEVPIDLIADIDVGHTVTLTHERYGFSGGVAMFVDGLAESHETGKLTLTLVA